MIVVTALFLLAVTGTITDPTGTTGTTSSATGATGTGVRGPAGSNPEGASAEGQAGNAIDLDGQPVQPPVQPPFVLGVGSPDTRIQDRTRVRDTYRGPPSGTVLELSTAPARVDPLKPRLMPR